MNMKKKILSVALSSMLVLQGCSTAFNQTTRNDVVINSKSCLIDGLTSERQILEERHGYFKNDISELVCNDNSINTGYISSAYSGDDRYQMRYFDNLSKRSEYEATGSSDLAKNILIGALVVGAVYLVAHEAHHKLDDVDFGGYSYRYRKETIFRHGGYVDICRDTLTGRFTYNYNCGF